MKSRRTTPALVTIFLVLSILFLWCPFSVASVTGGQTEEPTATDEHIYVQDLSGSVIIINDGETGYNNATTQITINYPADETETSEEAVSEDETAESATSVEEAENEASADETENPEEASSDSSTSHQATLVDAVQILKILAGVDTDLNSELCDISGDGKIGIEEAIFCLRAAAGLTESSDFNCSETSTPMTNMEDQKGQSHAGADKASVSDDMNPPDSSGLSVTTSVSEEGEAVVEDQKAQSHGGADKASVSEDDVSSYSSPLFLGPIDR